ITPDEKYETAKLDRLQVELYRSGLFNFTRSYFGAHPASLPKGWMPDEPLLGELKTYLKSHGTVFTEADFARHHDWIKRYLSQEMYTTAFNVDESDAIFARTDPEVEAAVDMMPKASALLETAKKIIVQRTKSQRWHVGTDKTAMNFRRLLPEIRWQSCLSPVPFPIPSSIITYRGSESGCVCFGSDRRRDHERRGLTLAYRQREERFDHWGGPRHR